MKRLIPLFALAILPGLVGCAVAQTWDDKTINEKTLNQVCKSGLEANLLIGRRPDGTYGGFINYSLRARVLNNKMTTRDYEGVRKWFKANCPDGW
jgi:hypothetical protein